MTSTSLSITQRFSISETLIVSLFNGFRHGTLRLQWPNGREMTFGNGTGTPASIRVTNLNFFRKCTLYGDIGFGESYMDGDWHTNSLYDVINWFVINLNHNPVLTGKGFARLTGNFMRWINRIYHLTRSNSLSGSQKNIAEHYDLGNDFYKLFLDASMTYSSAIFTSPDQSLEDAQTEKYDRLCRQLKLQPTDQVLEIGSGWGGFALHAAKKYGCRITTVTISKAQYEYAGKKFQARGVSDQVDIRLQDYRHLQGKFDKIVSIEMIEAVGHHNLPVYFQKCNELLKPGGRLAIQVITSRDKRYEEFRTDVDFIQKHIFPGSQTPSLLAMQQAIAKVAALDLYNVKDLGQDYAETLRHWFRSFNQQLAEVKALGMSDSFIRKWNYYLQYCEAIFRSGHISVLQLLYTKL